jgi:hypothetical protein
MVIVSDPKNLNLAQQLVADREQCLREVNRVANRPRNQSYKTIPAPKQNITDPRLQTFARSSGRPLDDHVKPK